MGSDSRRFELPYAAVPGRLVNGALGLRSIALRDGEEAPYEMSVTLLDTPDWRMVRAGVWLAHRVLEGRGDWYLSAPEWTPWLPAEQIELMGHDDLPEEFAARVRPFRRGAPLGPVAAVTIQREEFVLRGDDARALAVLRDDRVKIRSGGVVTSRFRELEITDVGDGLTGRQRSWVAEVLVQAGALPVAEFPSLTQRLGAPATGLSDLPPPPVHDPNGTVEMAVSGFIGAGLRALTVADLRYRTGGPPDPAAAGSAHSIAARELWTELRELRTGIRAFSPLLDPQWATSLVEEIDWATDQLSPCLKSGKKPVVVNSQRYLRLLDRLVSACRAPALGNHGPELADPALELLLRRQIKLFRARCDGLTPASPDPDWAQALEAGALIDDCCAVQFQTPKSVRKLRRRVRRLVRGLTGTVAAGVPEPALVEALRPAEAFVAGREYEQALVLQHTARLDFLQQWEAGGRKVGWPRD